MDDLLGEDWQSSAKSTSANPPLNPIPSISNYDRFRASPALSSSTISTPLSLSRPSSTLNGGSKAPMNDQFGNLLATKSQKAQGTSNLSMQERQRQIVEERRRQQEQQAQVWDKFGNGRSTPNFGGPSPNVSIQETEDDILAAFNKDAPVDRASHHPPPSIPSTSERNTPALVQSPPGHNAAHGLFNDDNDDDDVFGLGSAPKRSNTTLKTSELTNHDDDILGDLGKPVVKIPPQQLSAVEPKPTQETVYYHHEVTADMPQDNEVAELVDMGFPADTAKIALSETGGNVQSAVSWLLRQAHEESRQKAQKSRVEPQERRHSPQAGSRSPQRRLRGEQGTVPPWMREELRSNSAARNQDTRSTHSEDKDASQMAQEFGSKFLKGANSLWKASQKQMAKTMADFQQDRDSGQPKWMQQAATEGARSSSQRREPEKPSRQEAKITNEAALLDMPRERPPKSTNASIERPAEPPSRHRTPIEPFPHQSITQPMPKQQASQLQEKRPVAKLNRQEIEDQSAQAYISPARRKRPTPKPEPKPEPEVDLFSPAPAKVTPVKSSVSTAPSRLVDSRTIAKPSPAVTPRPMARSRTIPSVNPTVLSASASHRKAGGEAFKRGDFASAHEAYTAALTPLPPTHPITIVVLCNRCLTALKTGDAKVAVADADKALAIIGASFGIGERIDLGAGEGAKDMREFYGKALMRKAEALEHMERWTDAAGVWRLAVEAGVGGTVSLRGKDRCEKAAAPPKAATSVTARAATAPTRKTPSFATTRPPPPAKGLGDSLNRPTLTSATSAAAVKKLRAANAAAEKADDERFALTDQVDARLAAWKAGKSENLRALLQSLDNVLWESAGWKKVGMSDLVMPNKVKIAYMKAIAKVHPDKIPQDATTEQRMISGSVFSTLNEAWDKFKKDNNL